MPKRKYSRKKRTTKKRKYTRRKRRYTRRKPLVLGGIPDQRVCRLRYCEFVKLDATALGSAVAVQHTFNANSVYDPNQTTTGHQPMGYDEMASQYNHYVVLGSKITVHFDNDVDNVQLAGQYCFLRLDDAVPATNDNLVAMMERANSHISYKPRNVDTNRPVTLTKNLSLQENFFWN